MFFITIWKIRNWQYTFNLQFWENLGLLCLAVSVMSFFDLGRMQGCMEYLQVGPMFLCIYISVQSSFKWFLLELQVFLKKKKKIENRNGAQSVSKSFVTIWLFRAGIHNAKHWKKCNLSFWIWLLQKLVRFQDWFKLSMIELPYCKENLLKGIKMAS